MDNKSVLVIEGVGFSHAMLRIAAAFYGVQWDATQIAGLVGTLSAQLSGTDKEVERILLDSAETRDMFKEVREAVYKVAGITDDSAQHPVLSIKEKIAEYDALLATIEQEEKDGTNRVYEQKEAGVLPPAPEAEAQAEQAAQEGAADTQAAEQDASNASQEAQESSDKASEASQGQEDQQA